MGKLASNIHGNPRASCRNFIETSSHCQKVAFLNSKSSIFFFPEKSVDEGSWLFVVLALGCDFFS